jgi:hypothetical protein
MASPAGGLQEASARARAIKKISELMLVSGAILYLSRRALTGDEGGVGSFSYWKADRSAGWLGGGAGASS